MNNLPIMSHILDVVPNCTHTNEFCCWFYIQEYAIIVAVSLNLITRPHFELKSINLLFVGNEEEFWESSYLLEVLLLESCFDNYVQKIENSGHLGSLLVEFIKIYLVFKLYDNLMTWVIGLSLKFNRVSIN